MSQLTKLSDLLRGVEAADRYSIYRAFKGAIKAGELAAVPTVGTVELQRKTKPLTITDFLISGDASQWLQQTQERRKQPKNKTHKHLVTLEDVEAGRVSFEEAAARYRDSLQPKTGRKVKRRSRKEDAPVSA